MKSTNPTSAALKAERRVGLAMEQVKAAEKEARAAKEKAWRAKLLFKLARRASKKAKRAAKRARTKAVQAQIALKELTEQIAAVTRPSGGTRAGASKPRRNAPRRFSTATAKSKRPVDVFKVIKAPGASAQQGRGQIRAASKPTKSRASSGSVTKKLQTLEAVDDGAEAVSGRQDVLDASKRPIAFGNPGEDGIRSGQASAETSPKNTP